MERRQDRRLKSASEGEEEGGSGSGMHASERDREERHTKARDGLLNDDESERRTLAETARRTLRTAYVAPLSPPGAAA
eukprot:scaffold2535_cov128-Isochrysis_galbana.AAC.4